MPASSSALKLVLCLSLLLLTPTVIQAKDLILETPINPVGNSNHPSSGASLGILVPVTVGAAPVEINQIGVYGNANSTVSLAWAIFLGNAAPELLIPAETITGGSGLQWHDSPVLDTPFVMNANTTYWIGPVVSGPTNGFTQPFNFPGTQVFGDGLTQQFGSNRNAFGPANAPTMGGSGSLQTMIRLYRPVNAVPEPTSGMLVGGLSLCGLLARRRK